MQYSIIATVNARNTIVLYARQFRVNQWLKNFVVFTAILFSGELFNPAPFWQTTYAFLILCLLSSTSYVLNDIIDYANDKKHPIKKHRPIASGQISMPQATFIVFLMTVISVIISLVFSVQFFILALVFILVHFFYSMYLKKHAVIDIFTISLSFMIRAYAGVVATGFPVPIWLMFTIFFGSLFIAAVKRDAELTAHGSVARESLKIYSSHFMSFLTVLFGTATIIAYSTFTYFARIESTNEDFAKFLSSYFPQFEARKWLMLTVPLVVYGVVRYAQLLYEKEQGERPEQIVTKDTPLIVAMALWALSIIVMLYIL